ncbi:MAG TPA: MFS transporter [Hyphomonadaceae bacterium]|nr:MFS transporter [Hyphomonadaceae bacterium]
MTATGGDPAFEAATFRRIAWRLVPLLFLGYIAAFLDRVNVGFAKLQMASDLAFSDAVYGFGAGIFFIGYFLFEVPSNLVLRKVGARLWLARIMISWGLISSAFLFTGVIPWGPVSSAFGLTDQQFSFYALRFLLGAAEAGFFPGVILYLTYWFPAQRRAQMVAWFMTAIAMSNIVGSPLSGAILQFMDGASGLRGWQWLFLLEGIPSVVIGLVFLFLLTDRPEVAKWLNDEERTLIERRIAEEESAKSSAGQGHSIIDAFRDPRVWAFCLVYFCGTQCLYAINFWMPTIISEFGVPAADYFRVGLLSMIPWGVTVIVMVLWARHSDMTGERRWHSAGGLFLAMFGLVALAFTDSSPILSMAALAAVTMGSLCWVTTFWSLPTSFLSGAAAAAGIAWINSIGNLGGYVGPELIGQIRTASNGDSDAAFFVLAGAALLGGLAILVATLKRRSAAPRRAA